MKNEPNTSKTSPMSSDIGQLPKKLNIVHHTYTPPMILNGLSSKPSLARILDDLPYRRQLNINIQNVALKTCTVIVKPLH